MRAVIFGAGRVGTDFFQEIKNREEVISFIDNDINKQGKDICGITIRSIQELNALRYDVIYIACLNNYREIKNQLTEYGISSAIISLRPVEKINNEIESKKIINSLHLYHETYHEIEYEEKWNEIKEKYGKIALHELRVDTIGETIIRFLLSTNHMIQDHNLHVFIPEATNACRICNKYILNLYEREIYIVREEETAFWAYVLRKHLEEVDISEYYKFTERHEYPVYKVDSRNCAHGFNDDEIERGKDFCKKINIDRPFVCITARTPAYNKNTIGYEYDYDYRNMEFSDYEMAIRYLQKQDLLAVKMGRTEDPIEKIDNCIDYAGLYANDFMDLYLSSQCEFFIANTTGSLYMAFLFGRPVLTVNRVPVSLGCGGCPYTEDSLFIPKKYYDEHHERYLSLREIIKVESQCLIWGKQYREKGIRFVDNTPEEIAEAVKEMVERLNGTWQDTPEDRQNYERYLTIYQEMETAALNNPDNWIGGPEPTRISAAYLRENLYLLE